MQITCPKNQKYVIWSNFFVFNWYGLIPYNFYEGYSTKKPLKNACFLHFLARGPSSITGPLARPKNGNNWIENMFHDYIPGPLLANDQDSECGPRFK